MAYVITAKELGTPDPTDGVLNYYTSAQGMIDINHAECTLVWSFQGILFYGSLGSGYPVFDSDQHYFHMGYAGEDGWDIVPKDTSGLTNFYRITDSPGLLELGLWHSCMFAIAADGSGKFWVAEVEGGPPVEVGTWPATNETLRPHNYFGVQRPGGVATLGNSVLNTGVPSARAQPCGISNVWCTNAHLDPATNWDKFFDGNNVPISTGVNGELPTGVPPLSFFPNGDPTDNRGFLDDWNEVGTVPDFPTSPTDSNQTGLVFPPVVF
jgi:hypothetical protein